MALPVETDHLNYLVGFLTFNLMKNKKDDCSCGGNCSCKDKKVHAGPLDRVKNFVQTIKLVYWDE